MMIKAFTRCFLFAPYSGFLTESGKTRASVILSTEDQTCFQVTQIRIKVSRLLRTTHWLELIFTLSFIQLLFQKQESDYLSIFLSSDFLIDSFFLIRCVKGPLAQNVAWCLHTMMLSLLMQTSTLRSSGSTTPGILRTTRSLSRTSESNCLC